MVCGPRSVTPRRAVAGMSAPYASALYVGWVRHRRHRPRQHAFRNRSFHALIDVDELPRLSRELRGFGHNRRALFGFRDTDHLGSLDLPVRDKLARWFADQGRSLPDGPVRVLANLRVAGHVFDPVSWWFCHDADGSLATVVAEVHSTFGEAHCYLLDLEQSDRPDVVRAVADKRLRVSPFLPVDGLGYRFTIVCQGERIAVHVDVDDEHGRVFDATQSGRRVALSSGSLARVALTHPMMPLHTVVMIHWQALRLWFKGVPYLRRSAGGDGGGRRGGLRADATASACDHHRGAGDPADKERVT